MKLVRATFFLTLAKLANALFMFMGRAVAARVLGPAGMGAFASAVTAMAVLSRLFSFGLGPASQYHSASGNMPRTELFTAVLLGATFAAGSSALLVFYTLDFWRYLFFEHNQIAFAYFKTFFPLLTALFAALGLNMFLLGCDHHREYAMVTLSAGLVFLLGCALVQHFDWGRDGILHAQIAVWLSGVSLALYFCLRGLGGRPQLPQVSLLKRVFSYGAKAAMVGTFTYILNRVALFAGNHLVSSEELGFYAVAALIAESLTQLYGMAGSMLMIRISRASSLEDGVRVVSLVSRVTLLLFLGTSLLLAVAAPILVPLVFGESFRKSVWVLIYLLPGLVAQTQQRLLLNYLYGRNLQHWALLVYAVKAIVLAASLPLFASRWGVAGLALAVTTGHLSALVANAWLLRALDGVPIQGLWRLRAPDLTIIRTTATKIWREKK